MEWTAIASLITLVAVVIGNIIYIAYQGGYIKRKLDSHDSEIDENSKSIKSIKDSFTRENGTTTYVTRKEFDKLENEMYNRIRKLEESNQRSNRKIIDALHSLEKQLAIINQHISDNKGKSPLNKDIQCFDSGEYDSYDSEENDPYGFG